MPMSKMASSTFTSSLEAATALAADERVVTLSRNLVCFFWVGTAGLGGHLLGTDEENVVMLHYLVYNITTQKIVEEHQFVVRPPSTPLSYNNSHSTNNNNNNNSHNNSSNNSDDGSRDPSKALMDNNAPIQLNDMCKRDYHLTEDRIRSEGQSLEVVLAKMEDIFDRIGRVESNNNSFTNNTHHHNNHHSSTNSTSSPTNNDTNSDSNLINIIRPLLITDGQLHLRQVVHPKVAFHGISLPQTYNAFVDLRKDFRRLYSTDEMTSLQDMVNYLDITVEEGHKNLSYKATATMVQIVARMHRDGHVFQEPEQIVVELEQGPLPKGEEVDSGCVVRARGLPWMSTEIEIARFFRGLNVAKSGVALCLSPQGRRNGEALIRFLTPEHRDMALRRHKHHMGGRYIEVYKATGEDFISVAGGNNNEATQFLARGSLIVRMRGLPYDCTPKQVVDFFESGENGVKLHENEDGVLFVRKSDGRATGDAFVLLSTEEDVTKALTKHRDLIGSRYIELFRSTSAEVMNRSMDVRHLEQQTQQPTMPPLIALPPMLPQQSVAQGPKKDCIRLRGLPFEAGIDHVLDFLGDFAKNIMFRGVHMVYTPQGQPSGEAFIQMTSETAAWTAAHHRHNRFMPCAGKKHRYIEVFQCSGDDMNLVLSGGNVGGSPSSVTSAPPPPAPGSLVPTPGGMLMWDDGSAHSRGVAAAAAAPPLLLPPPHVGQGPNAALQQPLSMAGLPSLPTPPSPTPAAGYMQQTHHVAAAAAAAAGIRPPSFPNMGGSVPHTLLPPPSNGMAMIPSHLHPSMKPQSQLLLPPPLSGNSRPPSLEVSLAQVSHGNLVKTTTVSAAGYPTNMFSCYPTSTSASSSSHTPSPVSPTMLYYQAPNVKLPTTLSSIMSMPPNAQLQYYTGFPPMPADTTTTSKYAQQLHYLPGSYASVQAAAMAPPPRRMLPPPTAAASQSVASKRSYDQAFPSGSDRNGGGTNTSVTSSLAAGGSGSGANGGAKRMAMNPASGSSLSHHTPRPAVMPPFSQAAHFAPHHLAAHPALAASHQFASASLNPALGANPMGAPMLHALYPPPMYPSM